MKIDITLCTFRRPEVVETLRSIDGIDLPEGATARVVVIDNDHQPSAQEAVEAQAASMRLPVTYLHAPAANIALARNAGLEAADADWVAFLDDDETVPRHWLTALTARQVETGADAVFGPSVALYDPDAPEWITAQDYHSNRPAPRNGVVETGYTCNAFLRWGEAPWTAERFDLARGKSGGEDTEFFFRLHRMGARFAIAEDAAVTETVPETRLTYEWLERRRFRMGQSYASSAPSPAARARLFAAASAKAAYCRARAIAAGRDEELRNFWRLRGSLHRGVCSGCLSRPSEDLYGS